MNINPAAKRVRLKRKFHQKQIKIAERYFGARVRDTRVIIGNDRGSIREVVLKPSGETWFFVENSNGKFHTKTQNYDEAVDAFIYDK